MKSTGQKRRRPWVFGVPIVGLMVGLGAGVLGVAGEGLPVDAARAAQKPEITHYGVRNALTLPQLWAAVKGGKDGLTVDLSHVRELADGTTIDPAKLYGSVCFGPYPFEAAETPYAYKRFRFRVAIAKGKATLKVGKLLIPKHNSEGWKDTGQIVIRLKLHLERPGQDRALGVYDTFATFRRTPQAVEKLPSIVEGPLINLLTSDDPTTAVISFVTDQAAAAAVVLDDGRRFPGPAAQRHQFLLDKLTPRKPYAYRVQIGATATRPYTFRAAPPAGHGPVTFAYCGDSREGGGSTLATFMGVNYSTMERLAAFAFFQGADLFVMGGDLINGYTASKADFHTQLHAWKQTMAGFWNHRPVYPIMGNHEALLRAFDYGERFPVSLDRWPYATDSAEAAFADAFINPANGPTPSDPRRPTYRENVFALQYGLVKILALNNNYWLGSKPAKFGGSPEGYILDDQMRWIEAQLEQAERSPTVKYVFLVLQEPPFPNGGHLKDTMWYSGDNAVRAHTFRQGKLHPAPQGIIEVRNRLVRAAAASPKVAAVLACDEHSYHRVLIDRSVPIGVPATDDKNRDGKIDWKGAEPASPIAGLKHPTWYITCGGGGAPYYAEEPAPWNRHWKAKKNPRAGYRYSSQENIILFRADDKGVSARVYTPYGELLDELPDLMAVKRSSPSR